MVKTAKLPDRPKPPNRQQIAEDFAAVTDDDIIFQDAKTGPTPLTGDGAKPDTAATGAGGESTSSHGDSEQSDKVPTSNVDVTYKNITKLIKVHKDLEKQPQQLRDTYEQLQKQSADIADSISELRTAAELVAKKS